MNTQIANNISIGLSMIALILLIILIERRKKIINCTDSNKLDKLVKTQKILGLVFYYLIGILIVILLAKFINTINI